MYHNLPHGLSSKEQAIVQGDNSNKYSFDATKFSTEFGIASGDFETRERGINGVGSLYVRLKQQTNGSVANQTPLATR